MPYIFFPSLPQGHPSAQQNIQVTPRPEGHSLYCLYFFILLRSFFFLLLPTFSKDCYVIIALWFDLHFFTKIVSLKVINDMLIIKAFVFDSLLVIAKLNKTRILNLLFLLFNTEPLLNHRLSILVSEFIIFYFFLSHTSIL